MNPTVATFRVPDGQLHYEVRGEGPLVALIGAPMDARSFEAAADLLATDHTVLTTDPRGINRSKLDDPSQESTPALRADDLSKLLAHLDRGPAAVLGSSGGAVTALAHAQAHPEQVHTVIAHEPPFNALLEDRKQQEAVVEDIIRTYKSGDVAGAWAIFLKNANFELPEGAMDGWEPDEQQIADDYYGWVHMLRATTAWVPDLDALRDGTPRILVGLGEESTGQYCERTSRALTAALGTEPTMFPGDHTGFAGVPAAFVPRLREVLEGK